MYIKVTLTYSPSVHGDLNKILKDYFVGSERVIFPVYEDPTQVAEDLFKINVFLSLWTRLDVHQFLDIHDHHYNLIALRGALDDRIEFLKPHCKTKSSSGIIVEIENHDVDYEDFPFLTNHFGWHETLKPYETYNDLLKRVPLELQREVFVNTISAFVYMDVEDIYKQNLGERDFTLERHSEDIHTMNEHMEFMLEFEKREDVDNESIRQYLSHRLDACHYLKEITPKEVKKSNFNFDSLYAPKE